MHLAEQIQIRYKKHSGGGNSSTPTEYWLACLDFLSIRAAVIAASYRFASDVQCFRPHTLYKFCFFIIVSFAFLHGCQAWQYANSLFLFPLMIFCFWQTANKSVLTSVDLCKLTDKSSAGLLCCDVSSSCLKDDPTSAPTHSTKVVRRKYVDFFFF